MNKMSYWTMPVLLCGCLGLVVGCGGGGGGGGEPADATTNAPADTVTNAPVDTVTQATPHQAKVLDTWTATLAGPGGNSSGPGTVSFHVDQTYSAASPAWSSKGAYTGSGRTVTLFGRDSEGRIGDVVLQLDGRTMTIASHYAGITGTLAKQ